MIANHTTPNSYAQKVDEFSSTHAASIVRDVEAARVVLRMVLLALCAEDSGAIRHAGKLGASRWHPAIDVVVSRLSGVRDALTETTNAPSLDWFTPLALASALASALWDGYCTSAPVLTLEETKTAAEVVIESLDDLLQCATLHGDGAMPAGSGVIQ